MVRMTGMDSGGLHVAVPGITRVTPTFRGGLSGDDLSCGAVGGQDLVTPLSLAPAFLQARDFRVSRVGETPACTVSSVAHEEEALEALSRSECFRVWRGLAHRRSVAATAVISCFLVF